MIKFFDLNNDGEVTDGEIERKISKNEKKQIEIRYAQRSIKNGLVFLVLYGTISISYCGYIYLWF